MTKQQGSQRTLCGRDFFSSDENQFKEAQMRCFYTALTLPFYKYQVPVGKKKTTQSVVQYILSTSLKRSNDVQKFVLETCKGVEGHKAFIDEFIVNPGVFAEDSARRVALGWFLRESGPRWTSVQLFAAAIEYCTTLESALERYEGAIDTSLL